MFDDDCELTYEEELEVERPANIYSLIRTLEFTEWAIMNTFINQKTHETEVNYILEQLDTAIAAYGDKWEGVEKFCQKYGLDECKLAKIRIAKGRIVAADEKLDITLIARLVQDLNDFYSDLETGGDEIVIAGITPRLHSIIMLLNKCRNFIPFNSPEVQKIISWNTKIIAERTATQTISAEEKAQLMVDLTLLSNIIQQE
jgi:hypothetical protein